MKKIRKASTKTTVFNASINTNTLNLAKKLEDASLTEEEMITKTVESKPKLKFHKRSKFTDCSRQKRRLSLTLPDPHDNQTDTLRSDDDIGDAPGTLAWNKESVKPTKAHSLNIKQEKQIQSNSQRPSKHPNGAVDLLFPHDIISERKTDLIANKRRLKACFLNSLTNDIVSYQKKTNEKKHKVERDEGAINSKLTSRRIEGTCMVPLKARTMQKPIYSNESDSKSPAKRDKGDEPKLQSSIQPISESKREEIIPSKESAVGLPYRCSEFGMYLTKIKPKKKFTYIYDVLPDFNTLETQYIGSNDSSLANDKLINGTNTREGILQRFNDALKFFKHKPDGKGEHAKIVKKETSQVIPNKKSPKSQRKKTRRLNKSKIVNPFKEIMFPPYDSEICFGGTSNKSGSCHIEQTRKSQHKVNFDTAGGLIEELVTSQNNPVDEADCTGEQTNMALVSSKLKCKNRKRLIVGSVKAEVRMDGGVDELRLRAQGELAARGYDVLSRVQRAEGRGPHVVALLADNRNSRRRSPVEITVYRKPVTKFVSSLMTVEGPGWREYYSQRPVKLLPPHSNLIMLLHRFETRMQTYQVTEHCAWPTLSQLLTLNTSDPEPQALSENECRTIFRQICAGLHHLHSNDMLHGDLGCHNVLVTDTLNVKLTGYGPCCQRIMPNLLTSHRSKSIDSAMPPEVGGLRSAWRRASDVWAAGAALLHMMLGRPPRSLDSHTARLNSPKIQYKVTLLIDAMLQTQPSFRPTIGRVLRHSWLRQDSWSVPGQQQDSHDMCSSWLHFKCAEASDGKSDSDVSHSRSRSYTSSTSLTMPKGSSSCKGLKNLERNKDKSFPNPKAHQARDGTSKIQSDESMQEIQSTSCSKDDNVESTSKQLYRSMIQSCSGSIPPSPKRPVTTPIYDLAPELNSVTSNMIYSDRSEAACSDLISSQYSVVGERLREHDKNKGIRDDDELNRSITGSEFNDNESFYDYKIKQNTSLTEHGTDNDTIDGNEVDRSLSDNENNENDIFYDNKIKWSSSFESIKTDMRQDVLPGPINDNFAVTDQAETRDSEFNTHNANNENDNSTELKNENYKPKNCEINQKNARGTPKNTHLDYGILSKKSIESENTTLSAPDSDTLSNSSDCSNIMHQTTSKPFIQSHLFNVSDNNIEENNFKKDKNFRYVNDNEIFADDSSKSVSEDTESYGLPSKTVTCKPPVCPRSRRKQSTDYNMNNIRLCRKEKRLQLN